MDVGQYLVGLLFFAGTLGSSVLTAWLLWRRHLRNLEGLVGFLAGATLFCAAVVVTHLLPGMLGLLTRVGALVTGAALAAATAVVTRRGVWGSPTAASPSHEPSREAHTGWASTASAGLALVVLAWGLTLLWERKTTLAAPPFSFDMLTFDFPLIARWIQAGSIWVAHDLVALTSHSAYPQNGDVIYLAAILPWRNAFLAPLISYPVLLLGALAIYALAIAVGAARWASVALAAVFVATPLFFLTAVVDDLPDVFMWAMFACGVLFLVRDVQRPAISELVLAGLGLGLAFGSKWYGLTCVPIVVAMWLAASAAAGRGRRLRRDAPVLVGVILVVGGFWLVRNILEYGDPIFPHQVTLFGVTLFPSPVDTLGRAVGFTLAHYIGDWGVWGTYIVPEYRSALHLAGALLAAGLVVAAMAGLVRARHRSRRAVAGARRAVAGARPTGAVYVAWAGVVIVLVYVVTPQTAVGREGMPLLVGINARYAGPALLLGASVSAWGLSLPRRRVWIAALVVAAVAVADAYRSPLTVSAVRAVVAIAILLTSWWVLSRGRRAAPAWGTPRARRLLAAAGAVGLVGAAGAGYALQRGFNSDARGGQDQVVDWVLTHARGGDRIGITGSWTPDVAPVFAMFGPRLGNTVRYVGRVDRGLVQHYTSYGEWLRAIRADRLNLLLVGRQPQPLESDIEATWAVRRRFPVIVMSSRFILYRPTPPVGAAAELKARGG